MKKHLKILLINFAVLIAMLIIVEMVFRLLGYSAGPEYRKEIIKFNNLHDVDSLIVYDNFSTDSTGLFKANPQWKWSDTSIKINSEGFRTHEFSDTFPNRKRIMLIGDSYTWGASATPITMSFADILERESNFVVYNFGIPGTSPNQYARIAELYMKKIKPDIVIVAFCTGNDVMEEDYPMAPNENLFHSTNAGMISSYVDGKYISDPKEALDLNLERYRSIVFPEVSSCNSFKCWLREFLFSTVIGTRLYMGLHNLTTRYNESNGNGDPEISLKYLRKINLLSNENGADFFIVVLPPPTQGQLNREFFEDLKDFTFLPSDFSSDDFTAPPDGHFNNTGHRKFANFLLNILKKR